VNTREMVEPKILTMAINRVGKITGAR